MQIKSLASTGDPYVDDCFHFDFEEFEEPRRWAAMPGIKDIPYIADTDKQKALTAAEAALKDNPDYSFLFYWIAKLRGSLGMPGEPQKTYLEGLQKGRNKPILCGGLAMHAFEHGDLAEAVKWWIKSAAIQFSCKLSVDGFSLLNLAYIAEGLHMPECQAPLLKAAQQLQSISFDAIGANERYHLALTQGNDSIKTAFDILCMFYLR